MSNTLIDSVRSVFTEPLLSKFATLLGETEANINKAVHAATSIALTDVVHKAHYQEETTKIRNLARQAASSDFFGQLHELSMDAGGLITGSVLLNKGTEFARSQYGTRMDPVVNEVSRYASVSLSSATFLTGLASFATLDAIGRHIANGPADVNELSSWLKSQRDSILYTVNTGLHVKEALGIQRYPWEKSVSARRNSGLYIALTLIVIAVIALFLYKSCQHTDAPVSVAPSDSSSTSTVPATKDSTTSSADTAAFTKVTLPNGQTLDAYKGGTEDKLVAFLNDPNAKLDKQNGNWFDFTRVTFASNSASLLLESDRQLKNIVAILNAFPKAKIKIGGYSDNTGDSLSNVRLSQQRADNILLQLKKLGAKSSQLTGAEGYGPRYPVGDNATAEGRAANRRMSINVKSK